jgi:NitT/TauT family transport system substrate-binding protein
MARKLLLLVLSVSFLIALTAAEGYAQQKIKFGTFLKGHPVSYLPVLAAEEKGFWKENGLQAEWVPFRGSGALMRGVAAGAVSIAVSTGAGVLQAASRGVPVVAVSELHKKDHFMAWVRADSPIREAKDLKGAKIGITRIGGTASAYTEVVLKSLGIEKDTKTVALGGVRPLIAGLKSKAVDVSVLSVYTMIKMKAAGEVRSVVTYDDFLPKQWLVHVVFAHQRLIDSDPGTVKGTVRAMLQAIGFIKKNQAWAVPKMKEMSGYPEQAAQDIYGLLRFTDTGRIDRKALENVLNFMIEYGIVKGDKRPSLDKVYTNKFVG